MNFKFCFVFLVCFFSVSLNVSAQGSGNSALEFNRSNYVRVPDHESLKISGQNPLSVEAWVKLKTEPDGHYFVVAKRLHHSYWGGYELKVRSDKKASFRIGENWGHWKRAESPNSLEVGQWYHLTGTFDGDDVKFYVNGSLEATVPYGNKNVRDSNTDLLIGKYAGSLKGMPGEKASDAFVVDEVRIWNVARTDAEIYNNKNIRLQGNEPGLVLYHPFDEGHGPTTADLTSNNNDGTLGPQGDEPLWVDSRAITVNNSTELKDALADEDIDLIFLGNSFPAGEVLTIDRKVSIDGNGNTIDGENSGGFDLESDAKLTMNNITLDNCRKDPHDWFIVAEDGADLTVMNSTFENGFGYIHLKGNNEGVIKDNIFREFNGAAISITGTYKNEIKDNDFFDNNKGAIQYIGQSGAGLDKSDMEAMRGTNTFDPAAVLTNEGNGDPDIVPETSVHVFNTTQEIHYITIQGAISAADPDDILEVAPGTYTETIQIEKSITINGMVEGDDRPVIIAPQLPVKHESEEKVRNPAIVSIYSIIKSNSPPEVSFSGIEIDGKNHANYNSAIFAAGAHVELDNMIVHSISPSEPGSSSSGIRIENGTAEITDCTITNIRAQGEAHGIQVSGHQNVTITGNKVMNVFGYQSDINGKGNGYLSLGSAAIRVTDAANTLIEKNMITQDVLDNESTEPHHYDLFAGILIDNSDGLTISKNIIREMVFGVYVFSSPHIIAEDNTITGGLLGIGATDYDIFTDSFKSNSFYDADLMTLIQEQLTGKSTDKNDFTVNLWKLKGNTVAESYIGVWVINESDKTADKPKFVAKKNIVQNNKDHGFFIVDNGSLKPVIN